MGLPEKGSIGELVRYRIETAKSDLKSANILMKEGEYRGNHSARADWTDRGLLLKPIKGIDF